MKYEVRLGGGYGMSDIVTLARRPGEESLELSVVVRLPDGRSGTPSNPVDGALYVTTGGSRNDFEMHGSIFVHSAPPDGPVELDFAWERGNLKPTTVVVPGSRIRAASDGVIDTF